MHSFRYLLLSLLLAGLPLGAQAESFVDRIIDPIEELLEPVEAEPYWLVQVSVYTRHFHPKPHHNNHQELFGIERNRDDSYVWGAATFMNSFDQRSVIAYAGKRFDYPGTPFYSRLTFGLIHGYRGEYQDKVPFNNLGVGPVILPSIGVHYKGVQSDVVFLGLNAGLVTLGVRI